MPQFESFYMVPISQPSCLTVGDENENIIQPRVRPLDSTIKNPKIYSGFRFLALWRGGGGGQFWAKMALRN